MNCSFTSRACVNSTIPVENCGVDVFHLKTCQDVKQRTLEDCRTDCSQCCDPHKSGFLWCDACNDKCWTVADNQYTAETSSATLACGSCGFAPWRFTPVNGVAGWSISGTRARLITHIVIDEHDLYRFGGSALVIRVNGQNVEPVNYTSSNISVLPEVDLCTFEDCGDRIVVEIPPTEAFSVDVFLYLPNDVEYRVGQISLLQCFDIPNGLGLGAYPFGGGSDDIEEKETACGLPVTVRERKPVEYSVILRSLDECFTRTREYRSFLKYLQSGAPLYFLWSKNRYPHESVQSKLVKRIEKPNHRNTQCVDLTLQFKGFEKQEC